MGRVRKVIEKVNSKSCLLKTRFTIEFNSSQFKSKGIEKRRREVGLEPEGWTQEGAICFLAVTKIPFSKKMIQWKVSFLYLSRDKW